MTESPTPSETYAQLAELWLNSEVTLTREHFIPLATGARFYPHDPAVIIRMAALQIHRGEPKSALAILRFARARTRNERAAAIYDQFSAKIAESFAENR